jgi:tetratricopeptide (TPR) repeat protein
MTDVQNDSEGKTNYDRCPIPAAHRRLVESHLLWHQALSNYQEPDAFRANLNATIQALRNITFALQSEKHVIPNFDEWYGGWQSRLRVEPDAKWLHSARTIVVHQGDLEITSTALLKVLTWKDEVLIETQIPPAANTSVVLDSVPFLDLLKQTTTPSADLKDAALEIERRWSVAELKGREILETLARVYGLVGDLVLDAHAQVKQLQCIPIDPGHPDFRSAYHLTGTLECMAIGREQRTQRIKLASGEHYEVVTETSPVSEDDIKQAPKRYKLGKDHFAASWQSSDPIIVAENILARAKQILKKDKNHARMMFIRDGDGAWRQIVLNAADRTEKHILMRVVASFVERVGADVIIDVSESWVLPASSFYELDSHDIKDAPSRSEVLQVVLATREGICRAYTTPFARGVAGQVKLEDTAQSNDANFLHYLTPVFEVWRRQRTRTLGDGTRVLRVWEPDPLDTCFCGSTKRFIECCRSMMDQVRASDSIQQDIQTALDKGDASGAEQLARAALAQYIIWIRQHTAPTRTVAEPLRRDLVGIDVLALRAYVRQLDETLCANKHSDLFIPALERLSEIVGVPEISVRLVAIAAQSLAESGDTSGAASRLAVLGKLDQVTDALALHLAAKLMAWTPNEVASLLRRAIQVAYCEFERLSARLDLTKHLLGSEDSELALREVDLAITDATDAANRSMLAHALSLRWEITQEDEDFRKARTVLEALDPEQHWETLARLLIDHGDYDDAKTVLAKALEVGDVVAHLLAVDVHLRLGQTDSARKLLLAVSDGSIQSHLQYPYAYTMGLVALACNDPALKIEAASRLRKVLQETPTLEPAKVVLAALEGN